MYRTRFAVATIFIQLREVGGGDQRDESCRLLAGSHDPSTTVQNFTCSNLGLGKEFEVVIESRDFQNEEIHHFLCKQWSCVLPGVVCMFACRKSKTSPPVCFCCLQDLSESDYSLS